MVAYRARMMRRAAVVALVLLLAGCGDQVDEVGWRTDVEAVIGQPIADWPAYRDVWLDVCDDDDAGFGSFMAVSLDGGDTPEFLRANVRGGCPERGDELNGLLRE